MYGTKKDLWDIRNMVQSCFLKLEPGGISQEIYLFFVCCWWGIELHNGMCVSRNHSLFNDVNKYQMETVP
jgi:hypothetical protein